MNTTRSRLVQKFKEEQLELKREGLITGLAKEFSQDAYEDLHLDSKNYIEETGSLECTASAIPVRSLVKTLNVITQHEEKFKKDAENSKKAAQYVAHLQIARICVEQILTENKKNNYPFRK